MNVQAVSQLLHKDTLSYIADKYTKQEFIYKYPPAGSPQVQLEYLLKDFFINNVLVFAYNHVLIHYCEAKGWLIEGPIGILLEKLLII